MPTSKPTPDRSAQAAAAAQLAATRRREQRLLLVVAVALVVLAAAGVIAYRTLVSPPAAPTVGPSTTADQQPTEVLSGRPLLLGDAAAPVTLTLYEDFHCPHCADLEAELGPTIKDLQAAGTVKVDLLPMAFIDDGSTAASAAMACAAEAGFGQDYHDALFAGHEQQWNADLLVDLGATVAGKPDTGFETCVRTGANAGWVDSVNEAAAQANVVQTPTVFLDGVAVDIDDLTPQTLTEMVQQAARS